MYRKVWQLLKPFHRDYSRYLTGVVVRQLLLVVGGYSMVWVLRACQAHTSVPEWIFVAGLILYDAGFLRLDIRLNTMFAERLGYPMFGRLRTVALNKVFEMPLEWHHQQDSGTLVGKVNNGVGKVVQTAEAFSRELLPSLIRTGLSLVPLLLFSFYTAPPLLLALLVFMWLTAIENQKRAPYRKARYENYVKDFGVFSECVQYVQPVVQFGQASRMLNQYGSGATCCCRSRSGRVRASGSGNTGMESSTRVW
jgi:ABC-type multidrug transport system fused ATPase/permease subunit